MEYKKAKEIAMRIVKQLQPFCHYVEIAGSVRREKPEVKDIEIVCTPKTTKIADLFGETEMEQRLNHFCIAINLIGVVLKGDIKTGRYVQLALPENINLDIFIPNEHDLYRQVAIRTGPSEYSHKVLAAAWLKIGWCGTRDGLRLQKECFQKVVSTNNEGKEKKEWICNNPNPTLPPTWDSEYSFFSWLNLTWILPSDRK